MGAAALSFPAHARAGTYEVVACAAAQGANRAWVPFNTDASGLVTEDGCAAVMGGAADGLSSRDRVPAPPNAVAGTEAGWRFPAPPGTAISRITAQYYLGQFSSGEWLPFLRTADGTVLDSCVPASGQTRCERGASAFDPLGPSSSFAVNTSAVEAGVRCAAPSGTCGNGVGLNAAWMAMYSARVQINDLLLPSLVAPTGSLWADGFQSGARSATVAATDNTGIRSTWIAIDDTRRSSATRNCDYTRTIPCTNETGATLSLDTRTIPDGAHLATVGADDAGGNTSSESRMIVVDNTAPTAPVNLTLDGNARRSINSFNLAWRVPEGQVAPISAARWSLCPRGKSTSAECITGPGTTAQTLDGVAAPAIGDWDLRVWLVDAAGNANPSAAAGPLRLTLLGHDPRVRIRSVRRAGRLVRVSGITRARSGRINVRVERRVGGRTLRVQGTVRIRDGRWTRRLRLTTRMAQFMRLNAIARFDAQQGYRAAVARRAVPR
ncbi:hypothetical protein C8N24_0633 [Solirubrobacter pauli]|uniref:Uncharacterized protein n=1 Tax=Solirubrobacter pauli TaxID=166793 RepID=A0A660L6Z0_9ACTN|nr:hypothetical protein [Solirubrobacter pauli]RKQ90818.1 hypothetical protein C8N24_0633 [Solirubrobacter pauli]